LQAFLRGAARRNLRKRLRSDERRRRCEQEKMIGPVTEGPSAGRSLLEAMIDRELAERARAEAARTDEERRVLDLWLGGETEPAGIARALGLGDLPPAGQVRHVERTLARLRQRLHRFGQQFRGEGTGS